MAKPARKPIHQPRGCWPSSDDVADRVADGHEVVLVPHERVHLRFERQLGVRAVLGGRT